MKFVWWFDLETSGVYDNCGICQIAGLLEIDGQILAEFNWKVQLLPGNYIDPQAVEKTGITEEHLRLCGRDPHDTHNNLQQILRTILPPGEKFTLAGQKPDFDYRFLTRWAERLGGQFQDIVDYRHIDLIQLTACFVRAGLIKGLKDYSLREIATYFGITYKAHDALSDIKATREVYLRFEEWLKELKPREFAKLSPE